MPRKEEYWKNPEKYRKQALEYQKKHPEVRRKAWRRFYQKHKEKVKEYHRQHQRKPEIREKRRKRLVEWRKRNPKANAAHHMVDRHCELTPECELCPDDDKRTEGLLAHHPDYDYPYIFVTCCHSCHSYANRNTREVEMDGSLEDFIWS